MSDEPKKFPATLDNPPPQALAKREKKVTFVGLTQQDGDSALGPLESLEKSITNSIQAIRRGEEITRIAFEQDPALVNARGLWKRKSQWQVPDHVIKRIAITDDLIASIVAVRSNHLSVFGNELQDRFAMGFRIEPNRGVSEDWSPEKKESIQARIKKASRILGSCGHDEGVDQDQRMSLSNFLYQQTRNGILFGRFATEITYVKDGGRNVFHSFRPVDASTVFAATPREGQQGEAIRERAFNYLQQLSNEELVPEAPAARDWAWFQVINDRAVQAFTPDELIVHDLYPTTDVELMGYPITPIDTCIAAVTTHLNITTHNKLYFQNGRAARGMIVFQSDDVDQSVIDSVRQHFQATANSVSNSFRVPIIGVGQQDKVAWQPIEAQGGRDMEFQYLSDANARTIMSAFQMSPEEIPGYQHLARGTNSQTLSESSSEYKLEAARDIGIRPLMAHFQGFLNARILPLIDKELAQLCTLKFYGLDSENEEKELTMLEKAMPQHGTYDEWLERVEKDPIGKEFGGEFPLNPAYQQILYTNFTVADIKAHFFGDQKAKEDPTLQYIRDPFWFQWQQLLMQQSQMQAQEQQMQAQQQAQGAAPQAQGQPSAPKEQGSPDTQEQPDQQQPTSDTASGDAQQIEQELSKAESQMSPQGRRVLQQHRLTVKNTMKVWQKEAKTALAAIVAATKKMTN